MLMKKIKSAGILFLAAALFSGCGGSNEAAQAIEVYSYSAGDSSYSIENDRLKMEMDPSTTYFTVTDKSSGAVWRSNPEGAADDAAADEQSKNLLQSTLSIEYMQAASGVVAVLNNFEYSIKKSTYTIEEGKDYIKVNYTIGDTKKVFTIPPALPESRMKKFLDKMDNSGKKAIKDGYKKYDINNLTSDEKSKMLESYPELEKECVYVLRDGLQDHIKQKLQSFFEKAGYTQKDFEEDSAKYSGQSDEDSPVFNISVVYKLEGDDLVVELPIENMEWKDSSPLTKVDVLPYFGAGGKEDNGFLLVPDGMGGIINFNNGKQKQSSYYADVYGWDYAMKRTALIDESRTAFPVFGVAKNGNSFLCILEDNASVATIKADVSGRGHSYNYAGATYRVVHGDAIEISSRSDKTVMAFEEGKPTGSFKQRYRFIDSDDYSKMAQSYREYLTSKYPGLKKRSETGVPVGIEIIGAVDKIKQVLGFPTSLPEPLTTYKEALEMLKDLNSSGFGNMYVKYSGWMNGGVNQSSLARVSLVPGLGGSGNLKKLAEYASQIKAPLYLEGTVEYAYNNKLLDGFSINRDSAKYTSREVVKLTDFSAVWYGKKPDAKPYYLVKPQVSEQYMMNLSKAAGKYKASGVAFSDIGYGLAADYNPKDRVTRQESMEMQRQALAKIKESGKGVMLNTGNEYAIEYADYITEMDLIGGRFNIIDYQVPFYAMAIHGLVNYSGDYVNLSQDYTETVLKSAETGAGLSFAFMKEPASTLQETNYTRYFGADYDEWKELATEIYSRYEKELGSCFGQYIEKHEKLADGVFATTYEDGTKVYVNYNDLPYDKSGVKIPARDYAVERG